MACLKLFSILQAQAIQTNENDRRGVEGRVGAHQQAPASRRMNHGDGAEQAARGPQQQVAYAVLDGDVGLTVHRLAARWKALGLCSIERTLMFLPCTLCQLCLRGPRS